MTRILIIPVIIVIVAALIFFNWSNIINLVLPSGSRPETINFPVEKSTAEGYEAMAAKLKTDFGKEFPHVDRFRKAGILAYEGPKTCLSCHKTIEIEDTSTKAKKKIDLMDNVVTSAHFRFYTERHPNVWGFNGKLADNFAMGKINRPCPKPGSFAMTAWASFVVLKNGDTLSEGCGQCHIGGESAPPLGEMMPGYKVLNEEKETIDCLICHSAAYDMNRKQVALDQQGGKYWDQDRSLRAAVSVEQPSSQACLRCHQHNLGGDIYIDPADSSFFQSQLNAGTNRPRVLHPGSKRGTPFSPTWDVHAAAGVNCIDCHITEGHYIAKGTHTTTMMANDLPNTEVACETCHTNAPHESDAKAADYLNNHTDKIACVTCHIPSLNPDNATMRDFANPVYEEKAGIWVYDDILKETEPSKGIIYAWWNGDGTFLGNPIGDNPNGKNLYRFYKPTHIWPEFKDFDYAGWYERVMRPIAKNGRPSKLYAMKLFNGRQHIDLQNMGPFGGMYLPYNLPTYYVTGNSDSAAAVEMAHPMMKMMYGRLFKYYMMDKFMSFMDVPTWNGSAYDDARHLRKVEPRWIPQDASLEISHAIRKDGALTCSNCHSSSGILDFKALGYDDEETKSLQEPRVL